ncbi:MAG TPA: hypothetical protein DEP63_00015 [Candidatus Magasanikbacteria bacterium]|uniref:Antitoxin n=1 Tax=Candidatus Magasanikbacteria bacterium GW2011_GWE2_42_7 TaxID=1619052 RepID=A0A0G1BDJ2_9BACT|nr:MAG: hypothetical protein UV42_C0028G0007 [Candidatus Magasanikbacteria bacterium GW2011_GWE2_42_7]HBB38262.1 hypothetical protein [Candidatus Magasanikbacteria bacterium]HCC13127.1 hypothetical protein [Candidatus Magasanikbacteria bacterium]HCM54178.1 hypothetical protein [Candidatus Magasanikbacteria bacterium]
MNIMIKDLVTLNDLRQNMQTYIEKIAKGSSFTVYRRSKPIFRISPIEEDTAWETVIDFTKIKKGGVDIEDLLSRL